MTLVYLKPDQRKQQIIAAALKLSCKKGYQHATRDEIANEAGCAQGLITYHFTTMAQLRRAIMRAAVKDGVLTVIAQGIAARDPQALKAPKELQSRALDSLKQ